MPQTNDQGFNLTKATKFGRGFVKWGSIFLVVMIFGRITWEAGVAYWKATHPEPPPPPTRGFGLVLPEIEFPPETETPDSYKLEYPSTKWPDFGDRAVVYFMPKKEAGLLDVDAARSIARKYGFNSQPQQLNSTTLLWNGSQRLNITFEIDIISQNFRYSTDYLAHPELILDSNAENAFNSVQRVKSFLSTGGLLPADVATASGKVTYLRAVGGELQEAVSVSDAQFVQVDLNRHDLDNRFPIYTADGKTGTIHAIISSALGGNGVVEMVRNYWPIDYSLTHTYYLRSVASAWEILQAGEGYVAQPGNQDVAIIRDVTLGYYEGDAPQMYLQPIYVFKGDGGFLGYVPALSPDQSDRSR